MPWWLQTSQRKAKEKHLTVENLYQRKKEKQFSFSNALPIAGGWIDGGLASFFPSNFNLPPAGVQSLLPT